MIIGKTALLVIDMQNDFIGDAAPCTCPGAEDIIPRIQNLIAACRKAAIPVIYTVEVHRPSGIDSGHERRPHCFTGSRGAAICDELTLAAAEVVVTKTRYDAFMDTDLSHVLHGYNVRANDTLIVCGLATNICVHYTCAGAFQRDYHFRVIGDCCAGYSQSLHDSALENLNILERDSHLTLADILPEISRYGEQNK